MTLILRNSSDNENNNNNKWKKCRNAETILIDTETVIIQKVLVRTRPK